jgi:hypothetical protein
MWYNPLERNEKENSIMDDVLFENRYTEDKTLVREFHKYCLCKTHRKVGIIMLLIGVVTGAIMSLNQFGVVSITGTKGVILWEVSIVAFVLGFMLSIYYLMTTRIALRQDRKAMGGEIPETVIQFTDRDVIISELGKIKTFHYRELGEVIETKNLFVLPISRYAAVVAAKAGFTYGNTDDFREFIEAKYDPSRRI